MMTHPAEALPPSDNHTRERLLLARWLLEALPRSTRRDAILTQIDNWIAELPPAPIAEVLRDLPDFLVEAGVLKVVDLSTTPLWTEQERK